MRNFNELPKSESSEAEIIPFESRRVESEPRNFAGSPRPESLLPKHLIEDLHSRWDTIQASFIDEPSGAVKDADKLIASALQQISGAFTAQREELETQWNRGDDVSTEDLRIALQRYRSFFSRLLSI